MGTAAFAQRRFSFDTPLAIPPLLRGDIKSGNRVFDLKLQNGETEFFPGYKTKTKGINGSYLGPALRMRRGETVRVNVQNALGHASTLHWHGFNLPAAADGGPHQIIADGDTWSPEFKVQEVASTMWFHAHQMGQTASQVWAGLAGLVLIDDDEADALALPSVYGVDDVPLVLQDRAFNRDGSMPYRLSMHSEMAGMIGDVPVINGTILPHFTVTSRKLRLRLLNGANASIYDLTFSDRRKFHQIASDGGLLEAPVALTHLRLAPGERAEIVVAFKPGETVLLKSIASSRGGMGMMMAQALDFDLVEFRAGPELRPSNDLPNRLATLPAASATDATNHRKFLLEMPGMGPMRMFGRGGGFTINSQEMDINTVNEVVKMAEAEVWEIQNPGPMTHPFHIHNTQFCILDRNGRKPALNEAGRKDTVVVEPGETVRLLVRFDHYSDPTRPYMYHCHILEQEDAGMMGQFTVV
jgi:FtsP/CotA-like multicopper oxidase with cupredoxin domain